MSIFSQPIRSRFRKNNLEKLFVTSAHILHSCKAKLIQVDVKILQDFGKHWVLQMSILNLVIHFLLTQSIQFALPRIKPETPVRIRQKKGLTCTLYPISDYILNCKRKHLQNFPDWIHLPLSFLFVISSRYLALGILIHDLDSGGTLTWTIIKVQKKKKELP